MAADDLIDMSTQVRESLLGQLDARREEIGLQKKELGERAGVNRNSVQRAAKGEDLMVSSLIQMALAVNLIPTLAKPASGDGFVMPKDIVHRGLAHNRTRTKDVSLDRKRETALAQAWEKVNQHQDVGLSALMPHLVPGHTQEQATAAATVVQWLGSEIGFDFLTRTLHSAGYDIVKRR